MGKAKRKPKPSMPKYLDAHIESGITQKNLDKILDIIDDYIELKEVFIYDKQRNY